MYISKSIYIYIYLSNLSISIYCIYIYIIYIYIPVAINRGHLGKPFYTVEWWKPVIWIFFDKNTFFYCRMVML